MDGTILVPTTLPPRLEASWFSDSGAVNLEAIDRDLAELEAGDSSLDQRIGQLSWLLFARFESLQLAGVDEARIVRMFEIAGRLEVARERVLDGWQGLCERLASELQGMDRQPQPALRYYLKGWEALLLSIEDNAPENRDSLTSRVCTAFRSIGHLIGPDERSTGRITLRMASQLDADADSLALGASHLDVHHRTIDSREISITRLLFMDAPPVLRYVLLGREGMERLPEQPVLSGEQANRITLDGLEKFVRIVELGQFEVEAIPGGVEAIQNLAAQAIQLSEQFGFSDAFVEYWKGGLQRCLGQTLLCTYDRWFSRAEDFDAKDVPAGAIDTGEVEVLARWLDHLRLTSVEESNGTRVQPSVVQADLALLQQLSDTSPSDARLLGGWIRAAELLISKFEVLWPLFPEQCPQQLVDATLQVLEWRDADSVLAPASVDKLKLDHARHLWSMLMTPPKSIKGSDRKKEWGNWVRGWAPMVNALILYFERAIAQNLLTDKQIKGVVGRLRNMMPHLADCLKHQQTVTLSVQADPELRILQEHLFARLAPYQQRVAPAHCPPRMENASLHILEGARERGTQIFPLLREGKIADALTYANLAWMDQHAEVLQGWLDGHLEGVTAHMLLKRWEGLERLVDYEPPRTAAAAELVELHLHKQAAQALLEMCREVFEASRVDASLARFDGQTHHQLRALVPRFVLACALEREVDLQTVVGLVNQLILAVDPTVLESEQRQVVPLMFFNSPDMRRILLCDEAATISGPSIASLQAFCSLMETGDFSALSPTAPQERFRLAMEVKTVWDRYQCNGDSAAAWLKQVMSSLKLDGAQSLALNMRRAVIFNDADEMMRLIAEFNTKHPLNRYNEGISVESDGSLDGLRLIVHGHKHWPVKAVDELPSEFIRQLQIPLSQWLSTAGVDLIERLKQHKLASVKVIVPSNDVLANQSSGRRAPGIRRPSKGAISADAIWWERYKRVGAAVSEVVIPSSTLGNPFVTRFLGQCRQFERLTLEGATGRDHHAGDFDQVSLQVRRQCLNGGAAKSAPEALMPVFAHCQEVQELSIRGGASATTLTSLFELSRSNLTAVSLQRTRGIKEDGLDSMIEAMGSDHVVEVDLSHNHWVTGESLPKLLAGCPYLRRLNLHGCVNLNSRYLLPALQKAQGLEDLFLQDCANVGDESVPLILEQKLTLKRLNLNGTQVTAGEAERIAAECRELTSFYFNGQQMLEEVVESDSGSEEMDGGEELAADIAALHLDDE